MDKYDYLTSGEELKCFCGTEKAELKVAVRRTLTIDDKRIATMVDSLPDDNIGCFGQCMANPDAQHHVCLKDFGWMVVKELQ